MFSRPGEALFIFNVYDYLFLFFFIFFYRHPLVMRSKVECKRDKSASAVSV